MKYLARLILVAALGAVPFTLGGSASASAPAASLPEVMCPYQHGQQLYDLQLTNLDKPGAKPVTYGYWLNEYDARMWIPVGHWRVTIGVAGCLAESNPHAAASTAIPQAGASVPVPRARCPYRHGVPLYYMRVTNLHKAGSPTLTYGFWLNRWDPQWWLPLGVWRAPIRVAGCLAEASGTPLSQGA